MSATLPGRASAWLAAASLVLSSALLGCGKPTSEPGHKVACTCTFLTDYDDAARVDVDVCVGDGKPVDAAAKSCAARSAHNHVEGCTCGPKTGACDAAAKNACDAH